MDLLTSPFLKRAQLPSKNQHLRFIKSPSKKSKKVLILHPLPFLLTSDSLKGCSWPLGHHFPAADNLSKVSSIVLTKKDPKILF